jgi:hypothetical protein
MTKARDLANGGFGLVLVKPSSVVNGTDNGKGTVSFSAASTVSLNGVFNSTYTNYKILIDFTGSSATSDVVMRMRASGSDTAGTSYRYQRFRNISTTVTGQNQDNGVGNDEWFIGENVSGADAGSTFFDITILTPNVAKYTNYYSLHQNFNSGSIGMYTAGVLRDSLQYDGFTFYALSGNITGTVSVYGYNK